MTTEKIRFKDKHRGKIIVNPEKNYILRTKNIDTETAEIEKRIRSHIEDNTEDHIREEETNNNLDTGEEHIKGKTPEDAEQHTAKRKLK
jgi:hypothetical protein